MKECNKIELHPFKPFLPEGTKVVVCGTFPPKPDKWSMDFFYPNFFNDMWRIFGLIIFNEKEKFFNRETKTIDKEGIKKMLEKIHVGVGETVTKAIRQRDNASDKFLEVVERVNLPALLSQIPDCKDLVTTGEKAASVIAGLTNTPVPKVGEWIACSITMPDGSERRFRHWRMPSTSRAYPMKIEKKAEFYKRMLIETGVLNPGFS
ncbi:MAG: uracil-DNA glycosylase family protein [Muribaculaceae bacterium]|nr:uracil-DNA glycosylase family protein [Muribaculaceae bacterium]